MVPVTEYRSQNKYQNHRYKRHLKPHIKQGIRIPKEQEYGRNTGCIQRIAVSLEQFANSQQAGGY